MLLLRTTSILWVVPAAAQLLDAGAHAQRLDLFHLSLRSGDRRCSRLNALGSEGNALSPIAGKNLIIMGSLCMYLYKWHVFIFKYHLNNTDTRHARVSS
jgi:hypothetical protein